MQTSTQTDRSPPFAPGPIAPALLGWYDRHARVLPWRVPPGSGTAADPYRVWLSEVMLQQTTVAAVRDYFARFTARWPTVHDLAAADEAEIMAAWAGLGYYSRARNLIAAARAVAARGAFPDSEEALRALPGLGAYTAAAVAAIAFDRPAVVVDANVERVVARLFAIAEPLPAARKAIRAAAATITPATRPGDFAQAMMDLGAQVCTPRNPRCMLCPLQPMCRAQAKGNAADLPAKPPRKAKPKRRGHVWWIERAGQVWLVTRAARGMLGGMRAMPDDGWSARGDGDANPPFAADWRHGGAVAHSFTHFDLDLQLMLCDCGEIGHDLPGPAGEGTWWPIARIEAAGLPTVFAKAARLALAARDETTTRER